MTVVIPRAELHKVAVRYNDEHVDLDYDPSVWWVRGQAADLRSFGDDASVAEADALDALAARYERGAE